jgi:hypothetical protein
METSTQAETRQALVDLVTANLPLNTAFLFRRARRIALCNSTLVAAEGNAIALFAMFILQGILAQQALNPVTNLSNITSISNAIASLNVSLTAINIANTNS